MKLTKKRIEKYIEKLKKYCHKPKCKKWEECPEECECNPRLDFDTAIAWELTRNLVCILNEYYEPDLEFINDFISYLFTLKVYNSVIPKYKKLFNILDPLNNDFIETIFYLEK